MDQDSTKGSDKRNWRERLGIGGAANASPSRDLPRISEEYQVRDTKSGLPQNRPAGAGPRSAAVKPAPMAPRASKPGAPIAPEKLAERLRSQREAQSKLAEQRVQIARQRGEQPSSNGTERMASSIPPNAGIAVSPSGKPKFTFAEEEQHAASMQPRIPGQLQPPRQPLGATPTAPVFQPRPGAPGSLGSSAGQGTSRPGLPPAGYSPPPFPGYRPFEQSSGYVPPTRGMNANLGTNPSNGYTGQPRLNVPGRPSYPPSQDYTGYSPPPGVSADSRFNPSRSGRIPPPQRSPAPQYDDALPEEGFYPEQMPPPRAGRRSAADYQQAYRDMEQGYDEEAPRSRGPWILLGLLLLALAVAMAGVWYYQTTIKPQISTTSTGAQVPVVEAPAGQTTAPPEQPDSSASGAEAGGKKQIYDRIVGDQENVNGQLAPTEEVPIAPPVQSSQTPDQTVNPAAGPAGSDDAAPLPIPPPPDEYGSQGSSPLDPPNNAAELSNPAAGDSQAAAVSETAPAATPPAPGETAEANAITGETESEAIEPSVAPAPKPVAQPKKKVAAKTEGQGSKPLVLVPPADGADSTLAQSADASAEVGTPPPDGLYGTEETVASTAPVADPPVVKKKKKTLADLFNGTATEETSAQFTSNTQAPQPVKQAPAPAAPKQVVQQVTPAPTPIAPVEVQVASAAGYVAQIASFRTKQEANTEFGRLKSKHAGILQGTTPIISEATVAGSTRYRLAVGSFASKDAASSICSQLIKAGERDCLVKRQ